MWIRSAAWAAGTVAGILVATIIRPRNLEGIEILAGVAITLTIGLLGEMAVAVRSLRMPGRVVTPAGARPADGQVEIAAIRGVGRVPNERDPRFRAFQALEGSAEPEARLAVERGVSPPLLGRVALLSVFLGRDRRGWSDAEIAQAHSAMIRAGVWIEREAIRWQAPVNIALADTYFVIDGDETAEVEVAFVAEGDGVAPLEPHAVSRALIDLSRAASRLGFRDAADWVARINPRIDADFHVWLMHPRQAGRSLAIPLDQTELRGVSLAVCYAREANFPEPLVDLPFSDPVTIVHELLHLFGASDKYGVSLSAFAPRSVSSRDIMRLNESMLSRSRIDPLTAQELGWPVAQ